ncbi:RWD domain-containing protein 2B [Grifola frondosa]|uniref:RWD domain-containing protein 2B n=1 Tax=Grifola frondosa TaxID=5627 RepID=A0A1C7MSF1_GRIFR|nr:RWD domain-containing protein 2B [Grifola frondosa]
MSWSDILDAYSTESHISTELATPAQFLVKVEGASLWFCVELPPHYGDEYRPGAKNVPQITIKGDNLGRAEQERWQTIVKDTMQSLDHSEYPVFELVSMHLLPLLHAECDAAPEPPDTVCAPAPAPSEPEHFHALFTSHHLVSPTKRRSLHHWAGELALAGFAKVGHPGVIYCEGPRAAVEEFVARVKSMQWLALRLRFIEPLALVRDTAADGGVVHGTWVEFEKVGEVVEEMRRLGREHYVMEMGIGSAGTGSGSVLK